jgi:hypothetical protein
VRESYQEVTDSEPPGHMAISRDEDNTLSVDVPEIMAKQLEEIKY